MQQSQQYPNGTKIAAVAAVTETEVAFLGLGVYDGTCPVPWMGGLEDHKMTLENGDVVYGGEVWWGPANTMRDQVGEVRKINSARVIRRPDGVYAGFKLVPDEEIEKKKKKKKIDDALIEAAKDEKKEPNLPNPESPNSEKSQNSEVS